MSIPFHQFSQDDETSISFKILPLRQQTGYDPGDPHRHNYYEIFFFEKGGGDHTIDFETIPVHDQSIHFVSPGQVHQLRRASDSYGSVISFSREFYYLGLQEKNLLFEMPFLNNAMARTVLNLSEEAFSTCLHLVQAMAQEAGAALPYTPHQLRSYLNILMIQCKRFFEQQPPYHMHSHSEQPLFIRFRQTLEEHFFHLHQVQEYSEMLSVSDKQLNELVKAHSGYTALEYIHARLLLETKRLLLYSELSLKEIAFHLSFDDPSHFSRFFKSKTGTSPGHFREQHSGMYQ